MSATSSRLSLRKIGVLLLLIGLAGGGGFLLWRQYFAPPEAPSYRIAKVERGPLTSTVSASGTLAPVTQVQVGSQVSGQIKEVLADFNTEVRANQVVARIDPESFEARVAQAAAELEVAQAAVLVQRASLERARTDTQRADISRVDAEREYGRKRDLAERGVGSAAEKDRQEANALGAKAQLQGARAAGTMAEAQLANALAVVKQREAALRQARIDLERSYIRAPVDGVVILRNVDAGQTVAASLQSPVLFTIAETLTKMQVETSVDEADIGRLAEGMAASFTVDSLPGRTFEGSIRQIRKSPQVVQNVVTYTVVIAADNPDLKLLPGMTANVRIIVERRANALKLPNAALRFRAPAGAPVQAADGAASAASGPAPGPAPGPAGNIQAVRERLIRDLALSESQIQALDAAFAEFRSQLAGLGTGLTEAQRRQSIERLRAENRGRIAGLLTPEQRQRFQAMNAGAGNANGGSEGRVYRSKDGMLVALPLRVGITDGAYTEILGGGLREGDEIVIGLQSSSAGSAPSGNAAMPRLRL